MFIVHLVSIIHIHWTLLLLYFKANIHSIMGSEDQVLNLMRLLDDGIQQAENIESKLDSYDRILQVIFYLNLYTLQYLVLNLYHFFFFCIFLFH
jgi:hypothetical protein